MPTVVIATSSPADSWLRPVIEELHREGVSSDGALALAEQVGFEGAAIAVFANHADHFQLVVDAPGVLGRTLDPKSLTRAGLTALFERMDQARWRSEASLRPRGLQLAARSSQPECFDVATRWIASREPEALGPEPWYLKPEPGT